MADRRIWPLALGGALILHAVVLPIVVPVSSGALFPRAELTAEEPEAARTDLVDSIATAAPISLISEAELGAVMASRPAPFDSSSTSVANSHPMPRADDDRAGALAARQGGGEAGGAVRETLRRDREDLRAEIWNDSRRAQVATDGRGRQASSPEAVTRDPRRGFDGTTDARARAHGAEADPRPGDRLAQGEADRAGTSVPERDWRDADPVFDDMSARARHKGGTGRNSPEVKTAIADDGARAADVPQRGRLVEALDSSARSDARDPAPFELARPSAAGTDVGMRGTARDGLAPDGRGAGAGSRRSDVARGVAAESVHASRTDPYFRRVYAAIDRHIRFPRDLARRLEQGVVVVRFQLNPDGQISSIKLAKSSGFQGFDQAFLHAIKRAGRFGKVPQSVLRGAPSVWVTAPYKFANPMIR